MKIRLSSRRAYRAPTTTSADMLSESAIAPCSSWIVVVVRALGLADRLCWDSLECGDAVAFSRQTAICADLWEFGICARLFEEDLKFD